MPLTMMSIGLCFLALPGSYLVGSCKDYEEVSAGFENRMETATQMHSLVGDTIYYESDVSEVKNPCHIALIPLITPIDVDSDPRVEQVRLFFIKYKSPASKYAKLFVQIADENGLDWKLLPALAFIETGGGIYRYRGIYRNHNNIFGWGSGRIRFQSVEAGIRHVGIALTCGPYKGLTTYQKIRTFNKFRHYPGAVGRVMQWIDNTPVT